MLILSRKEQEEIYIGKDIRVIVTEIAKKNVKLAIIAPKHIMVLRSELIRDITDFNKRASLYNEDSVTELAQKIEK